TRAHPLPPGRESRFADGSVLCALRFRHGNPPETCNATRGLSEERVLTYATTFKSTAWRAFAANTVQRSPHTPPVGWHDARTAPPRRDRLHPGTPGPRCGSPGDPADGHRRADGAADLSAGGTAAGRPGRGPPGLAGGRRRRH